MNCSSLVFVCIPAYFHANILESQHCSTTYLNTSFYLDFWLETYRRTQLCWTGWWRPEGGRCSQTCCHSYRCWPRTGWHHRRPAGAWPSKTLRRGRTSSSWETSVRRRKATDEICCCVYKRFYISSFRLTSTTSRSSDVMSSLFCSGLSTSFVVSSSKTRPRYATPSPWQTRQECNGLNIQYKVLRSLE